ncbi:diaminopimelate decarboxylase family protein [Actinoplanes sp. HUAS TT8]|uniref:diaminopimelate decarboxylase family protein n=1 Tax=Actinoplanes sp. HUAS TT8 TaxID=3447453 RepID=UPI003F523DFA
MTLSEILPSLGASLRPRLDPADWPLSARWNEPGDLIVGGVRVAGLAAEHGTPVHVVDEADVHSRCAEYVAAFGVGAVSCSAKGGLLAGAARWIARDGLGCYCGSAADLRTALGAGIRADSLALFGSGKSVADLEAALACRAAVVVGSAAEVDAVAARSQEGQRVLLRVRPSATQRGYGAPAGGARRGYGVRVGSSAAVAAVATVRRSRKLVLAGLDCSLGHRLNRFGTYESFLREAIGFVARLRRPVPVFNLGGGHAADLPVGIFAARLRAVARVTSEGYGIEPPEIHVSPGRGLLGRAGITVHRVVAAGDGVIGLDGDVPDCLPGADCAGVHTAALIGRASPKPGRAFTVRCGDAVVAEAELPADVHEGDLVVLSGTGAYHQRRDAYVGRPAVIAVRGGRARTLLPRETVDRILHDA